MAAYVTVSMCEDCKIVFPNGFMKVEGDYQKQRENMKDNVSNSTCPECGKKITTLVDDGYWIRTN